MPLPPFTLIGATTRIGLLTGPMRSRFGIANHVEFYTPESLHEILRHNAKLLKLQGDDDARWRSCRGEAGGRRASPIGCCGACGISRPSRTKSKMTLKVTQEALKLEGIDDRGLDEQDRAYFRTLIENYDGGPGGRRGDRRQPWGRDRYAGGCRGADICCRLGLCMRTRQGTAGDQNGVRTFGVEMESASGQTAQGDPTLFRRRQLAHFNISAVDGVLSRREGARARSAVLPGRDPEAPVECGAELPGFFEAAGVGDFADGVVRCGKAGASRIFESGPGGFPDRGSARALCGSAFPGSGERDRFSSADLRR